MEGTWSPVPTLDRDSAPWVPHKSSAYQPALPLGSTCPVLVSLSSLTSTSSVPFKSHTVTYRTGVICRAPPRQADSGFIKRHSCAMCCVNLCAPSLAGKFYRSLTNISLPPAVPCRLLGELGDPAQSPLPHTQFQENPEF